MEYQERRETQGLLGLMFQDPLEREAVQEFLEHLVLWDPQEHQGIQEKQVPLDFQVLQSFLWFWIPEVKTYLIWFWYIIILYFSELTLSLKEKC